jgi:hypothetical protein
LDERRLGAEERDLKIQRSLRAERERTVFAALEGVFFRAQALPTSFNDERPAVNDPDREFRKLV